MSTNPSYSQDSDLEPAAKMGDGLGVVLYAINLMIESGCKGLPLFCL
jgi:hypothetical protein